MHDIRGYAVFKAYAEAGSEDGGHAAAPMGGKVLPELHFSSFWGQQYPKHCLVQ